MHDRARSPIQVAARRLQPGIMSTLAVGERRQSMLMAQDAFGYALAHENVQMLKELLDAGHDPNLPMPEGWTALTLACGTGLEGIATVLIEAGADLEYEVPEIGTALVCALDSGKRSLVERLLAAGADPNASGADWDPPLFRCLGKDWDDLALLLLEHGADPQRPSFSWTPLQAAMDARRFEVVKRLLVLGARPDLPSPQGWTPLQEALRMGEEKLAMEMLLRDGLDLDHAHPETALTALHIAAGQGQCAALGRLLDLGARWDALSATGISVFEMALRLHQEDAARFLLGRGAYPCSERRELPAPICLIAAAACGELGILQALVDRGAPLDDPDLPIAAAQEGRTEILRWLQGQGVDMNRPGAHGNIPLLAAAEYLHADAFTWLLAQSSDARYRDMEGASAMSIVLHGECEERSEDTASEAALEILEGLLEAGASLEDEAAADPDLVDALLSWARTEVCLWLLEHNLPLPPGEDWEGSPLLPAAMREDGDVLKALLDRGYPVNVRDESGATPLHWACTCGNVEGAFRLLDAGASIEVADRDGQTSLMVAADNKAVTCMRLLLDRGASPDTKDARGWTALMLSTVRRDADGVALLLKHGAKKGLKNAEGHTAHTLAQKAKDKALMRLLA